jgi:xylose isomerase
MATEAATTEESALVPRSEHRFTFGLWTVGHKGHDPFGEPTRPGLAPEETVRRLADLGAHGVCFHDNDLVPIEASENEAREIKERFRRALDETGMRVTMATTNLFFHPVFKDGAFTANDRQVRRFAVQKTLRAIELGMELGAPTFVFWGGREGVEADAAKPARDALERYRVPSTSYVSTCSTVATRCASRSSRSRTSRTATSFCRRSATRSPSSSDSSIRRWSA